MKFIKETLSHGLLNRTVNLDLGFNQAGAGMVRPIQLTTCADGIRQQIRALVMHCWEPINFDLNPPVVWCSGRSVRHRQVKVTNLPIGRTLRGII